MNKSTKDIVRPQQVLAPVSLSATTATASVDAQKGESLSFFVAVGAFAFDGTNKLSLTVQHSDDNSTFTDVDAIDLYKPDSGAIAKVLDEAGDQNTVHQVHYRGLKRYVRLNIVEAGAVTVTVAVIALQGYLKAAPEVYPQV